MPPTFLLPLEISPPCLIQMCISAPKERSSKAKATMEPASASLWPICTTVGLSSWACMRTPAMIRARVARKRRRRATVV